jgi:hypothetical protein
VRIVRIGLVVAMAFVTLTGCFALRPAPVQSSAAPPVAEEPVPEYTPPAPVVPTLDGIIVVTGLSSYSSSSVSVSAVDPTTGAADSWASFSSTTGSTTINSDVFLTAGSTPITVSSLFSDDFTRITASQPDPTAQVNHLGWLDKSGRFTNITQPLWDPDAFASVPSFRNPQFGADGNYYFTETPERDNQFFTSDAGILMSTSVVSPGLPTAVPGGDTDAMVYWVSPNGTISGQDAGSYFYQENVTKGKGTVRAQSWVDEKSWLGVDSAGNQIWYSSYLAKPGSINVMDWGTGGKAVTVKASGFTVWSPIVSPDKKTVAFLAKSASGVNIFTVPLEGGTPLILKTTALLDDSSMLATWK